MWLDKLLSGIQFELAYWWTLIVTQLSIIALSILCYIFCLMIACATIRTKWYHQYNDTKTKYFHKELIEIICWWHKKRRVNILSRKLFKIYQKFGLFTAIQIQRKSSIVYDENTSSAHSLCHLFLIRPNKIAILRIVYNVHWMMCLLFDDIFPIKVLSFNWFQISSRLAITKRMSSNEAILENFKFQPEATKTRKMNSVSSRWRNFEGKTNSF